MRKVVIVLAQFYPVLVALFFNLFDLISGFVAAVKNKEVASSKLRDGLFKKVGFVFCYFIGFMFDNYGSLVGFDMSAKVMPVILLVAVTTELTSIIENINKINPDLLPEKLLSIFHLGDDTK